MSFPRAALRTALAGISGFDAANIRWDVESRMPDGPRADKLRGQLELTPISDAPEGDDEFRQTYNEETELIEIEQISRRVCTVQFTCTVFDGTYAEDVLARVQKRLRRPDVLQELRDAGLALVSKYNIIHHPYQTDNRAVSRASLDVKFRYAVDSGDAPATETWIETFDLSEDDS